MTASIALDPANLRRVFAAFPSGIVGVAARIGETRVGLAASSFTPVSLDPPLVSLCIDRSSATWPVLRTARNVGVSVLEASQQPLSTSLASKNGDRFAGHAWRESEDGAVFAESAAAWLHCAIDREVEAGDHILCLLRINELDTIESAEPLVFHRSRYRVLAP